MAKENGRSAETTPLTLPNMEDQQQKPWVRRFITDVVSGGIAFLVVAVMSVSYSFAVFGMLGFGSLVGAGSRMALLGIVVVQTAALIGSEAPFMIVCPDLFICPLLNDMGRALAVSQDGGSTYAASTMVAVGATGIALVCAGQSALLRIGEFVPFPIVCGLLGAVGVVLLRQSYEIATVVMVGDGERNDCPLQGWWRTCLTYGPALLLGIFAIVLGKRVKRNPVRSTLPLFIMGVLGFYLVLFFMSYIFHSHDDAVAAATRCGFVFDPAILRGTPQGGGGKYRLEWQRLSVNWTEIVMNSRVWCDVVGLCLLVVLKSSLMFPAWERAFRGDYLKRGAQMDVQRELTTVGLGNIIAATLGTFGAQPQLTTGVSLREMGAGSLSKVPAATVVMLCLVLCGVVDGAAPLRFVPKFAFAGLLINQGWVLVQTFFLVPCFRSPRALTAAESLIVITILVVFVARGMLAGLSVGAQCSVFLFAVKSYDFGVFKYHASAAIMRSTTQRSPFACKRLDTDGHRIQILRLHSLLYFANASQVVKSIKQLLATNVSDDDDPMTTSYIIVDLTLVLDLDASAADAFVVAAELCHARQAVLLLTGCKHVSNHGTSVRDRIERSGLHLVDLMPGSGSQTLRQKSFHDQGDADDKIQFLDLSWSPSKSPRSVWVADTMDDALSTCEDAILYSSPDISSPRETSTFAPSFDDAEILSPLTRFKTTDGGKRAVSLDSSSFSNFERILRTLEQRCGAHFVNVESLMDLEPLTKVVSYAPGDAVLREASRFQSSSDIDDDRDGVVFIESGIVSIQREGSQAPTTCQGAGAIDFDAAPVFRMLRLGPGGVVGVPEFFTGRRSLGTTRAETNVVARLLPFRTIRQLQTDKAPVALALFHTMAHLLALAYDDRTEKLARTIDMIEERPRREIIPGLLHPRRKTNMITPSSHPKKRRVVTTPLSNIFHESDSGGESEDDNIV